MLRAFFRVLFGQRDDTPAPASSVTPQPPRTSQPPRWREPPTRTLSDNLGSGVIATVTYPTGHHGFVAVVGESHCQDVLRALAGRLESDGVFTARLVPQLDNPHDATAVAVCADGDLATFGHLARAVAKTYHPLLISHAAPVTCPARLVGLDQAMVGVVLDFEEVRVALGLERLSVDHGDIDYEASAEYQRLKQANRLFVDETRPMEESDPVEAVARYRRALATLLQCRDLVRVKNLEVHGYALNQTDATPIDRLTRCLVTMGKLEEAAKHLDTFIDDFPHARDMTLLKSARKGVDRALSARS